MFYAYFLFFIFHFYFLMFDKLKAILGIKLTVEIVSIKGLDDSTTSNLTTYSLKGLIALIKKFKG